jgi:glycosyltransferase involved in cell wall biosynthesis
VRICWRGFCGANHSWACVARALSKQFCDKHHKVEIFSTDGKNCIPKELINNIVGYFENGKLFGKELDHNYDIAISYTAPHNWKTYLQNGKIKLGIWAFEFAGKNSLPAGFAKQHSFCDKVLPPSEFAKQVFIDSGIPPQKIEIVPHGIDIKQLDNAQPINFNTNKIKLCAVLGQIHMRKGLDKTLEAFGKAFTKNDNVCFVLKVADKTPTQSFELSFKDELKRFKNKYPNHAQIIVINEFIDNMFSIYKACDIYFHLTKCEAFGIPFLEALSSGLINICPKYGGMLDFLNDDNAMLIDGKQAKAPSRSLYWEQKQNTMWFESNIDEAVDKLRYAVNNVEVMKQKIKPHIELVRNTYSWNKVADKVLGLVNI